MRVLVLTNLYPSPYQPYRGQFNRQQLRALSAQHAVRIIAPISWTDELAAWRRAPVRLPADRSVTADGIDVHHPRYLFPPKVLRRYYGQFFRRSVRQAFKQAVAEFRPDLIYAPWAYPDGWAAVELGHEAGLPVAIKVLGSDVMLLEKYAGRLDGTIEALKRADAVMTVGRLLAERVIGLGVAPDRVSVVYSGIDGDLFCPGPADVARSRLGLDPNDPVLLYVGNLVPIKGLDVLVDACAKLAADGARFKCYLVGQGPLRPKLEAQIARRGLVERVKLPGPRPLEQLPDWYRSASIFVLPSLSEGVPNVLMEAAACGVLSIATNVGGVPEIVDEHSGRLVPPGDPTALATAIKRALAGDFAGSTTSLFRPRTWEESAAALAKVFGSLSRAPLSAPRFEAPHSGPGCAAAIASGGP